MSPEQKIRYHSPEKRPPTPKIFLFDIGNVFLAASHTITHDYLESLGVQKIRAESYFKGSEYAEFSRGTIDDTTFFQRVRQRIGAPALSYDQIRAAHDMHIYGQVPGMQDLLTQLATIYPSSIMFVTDTNTWQTARQKELIDISSFPLIASNDIGMLKGDPDRITDEGKKESFFQYVLEKYKITPEEALLIDDSPEKVLRAKQCGMQTIQFENIQQTKQSLIEMQIINEES